MRRSIHVFSLALTLLGLAGVAAPSAHSETGQVPVSSQIAGVPVRSLPTQAGVTGVYAVRASSNHENASYTDYLTDPRARPLGRVRLGRRRLRRGSGPAPGLGTAPGHLGQCIPRRVFTRAPMRGYPE